MFARLHLMPAGRDKWSVWLEADSGKRSLLIPSSRDPEPDAARMLQHMGITGLAKTFRRGTHCMSFDIDHMATRAIIETVKSGPRLGKFVPFDREVFAA